MDEPDDGAGGYEVGRGKPPREHQFKAGQPSGNPHGRRGKPENRERNAARKAEKRAGNSLDEVIRREADKSRRVTTTDGRSKKMSTLEVIAAQVGNKAASGDLPAARIMFQQLRPRARVPTADEAVEPTCGVMVIPAAALTMDETMLLVEARDRELQREDEREAAEATREARTIRPDPPQQRAPDPRERRAYGPPEAPPPAPPGRRTMADGTFR